jgi:predicted transcriptional regulator
MAETVPTDRELEALKVLWRRGPSTVREICDEIGREGPELVYTTVLSLLQVMEQKGLVGHRQIGKAYVYSAEVRRESTFRSLAAGFLERVFDGALDQYLVHALRARSPEPEELDRLEKMIFEAKRRSQRREKKGPQP